MVRINIFVASDFICISHFNPIKIGSINRPYSKLLIHSSVDTGANLNASASGIYVVIVSSATKVTAKTQSEIEVKCDHKSFQWRSADRVARINTAFAVTNITKAHALAELGAAKFSIHV